ncbi:hypothetical protein Aduo_017075 [Ancylostoma duodenale]
MTFALVYFRSSRTSAVIPSSAVRGDIVVNNITRVKWEGKWYTAKILFIGSRILYEAKLDDVTIEGELIEDDFELADAHPEPSERVQNEGEQQSCSCSVEMARFREEFVARMNTLKNRLVAPSFESDTRAELRAIRMEQRASREQQNDILKRLPAFN